jgi:adenosylcobinamide-phosphate synthase
MGFSLALAALVIEALIGYPEALFAAIGHPATWIGRLIAFPEAHFNDAKASPQRRRMMGGLALGALLLIVGVLAEALTWILAIVSPAPLGFLLLALAASTLLAQRSLGKHVNSVAQAVEQESIVAARAAVAKIVGRDTNVLDRAGVARAAIESLAESFCDGVVAPALWIALFGLPGGALYKAINTADSMVGHLTPRYADFGFATAKLDDLVNWLAARLSALWIGLAALLLPKASAIGAWQIVRLDARSHVSPNAGWPEAAFAGALSFRLGGPRAYTQKKGGSQREDRWIGDGRADLGAPDIRLALQLYSRACLINWAALAVCAALAFLIVPG